MNLKEFFKPTKEKIILSVFLSSLGIIAGVLLIVLAVGTAPIPSYVYFFLPAAAFFAAPVILLSVSSTSIILIPFYLMLDIIFWYIISCLIIRSKNKFKEKKK